MSSEQVLHSLGMRVKDAELRDKTRSEGNADDLSAILSAHPIFKTTSGGNGSQRCDAPACAWSKPTSDSNER